MRKFKIIADSSSDIMSLDGFDYESAPLKIITDQREFVDDKDLNVKEMLDFLDKYNGRSRSSCPNLGDWLKAFGDADDIICFTLTSGMSGSYNAAVSAKQIYEEDNNGSSVFVVDSLSTGPEMRLLITKVCELAKEGLEFEEICTKITEYKEKTGLFFMLKSVKNFANNGRISPFLAKVIGVANICIVGKASDAGTLEPVHKCCGEHLALCKIRDELKNAGFFKGRIYLAHCHNPNGAYKLKEMIEEQFTHAKVEIFETRGLCSFYAEKGGILIGYEKM